MSTASAISGGRGFVHTIPFRSLFVPLDMAQIILAFVVLYFASHLRLMWLRTFTMHTVIWISALLGMQMRAVRPDLLVYRDKLCSFTVMCTFAHIFLSTSCILWNRRRSLVHNLVRLGAYALFLFVLNIVRLEIVFLLPDDPNELAHTIVTGVAGFVVYLSVVYQIEHPFAWFLTHGPEPYQTYPQDSLRHIALPSL